MYSTTEYFDAVGPVKESMPQDAYKDLLRCMHFSDDWEEDEDGDDWDTLYADTKSAPDPGTAIHRRKFAQLEDA